MPDAFSQSLADIWNNHRNTLIVLALAVVAALSTLIVVPETEQAVVVRLGTARSTASAPTPIMARAARAFRGAFRSLKRW
jgi:hypothetical protein